MILVSQKGAEGDTGLRGERSQLAVLCLGGKSEGEGGRVAIVQPGVGGHEAVRAFQEHNKQNTGSLTKETDENTHIQRELERRVVGGRLCFFKSVTKCASKWSVILDIYVWKYKHGVKCATALAWPLRVNRTCWSQAKDRTAPRLNYISKTVHFKSEFFQTLAPLARRALQPRRAAVLIKCWGIIHVLFHESCPVVGDILTSLSLKSLFSLDGTVSVESPTYAPPALSNTCWEIMTASVFDIEKPIVVFLGENQCLTHKIFYLPLMPLFDGCGGKM